MNKKSLLKLIQVLTGTLLAAFFIALIVGFLSQFVKVERMHKMENEIAIIKTHYIHIQKSLKDIKVEIGRISNGRNSTEAKMQASIDNFIDNRSRTN